MTKRVTWHGDKLMRRIEQAQREAIDETMAAAVLLAQADLYPGHGLITGILQGSLQAKRSKVMGRRIVGRWGGFDIRGRVRGRFGSVDTNYAFHVERRYGFLRKAADIEYPKLAKRLKARL